MDRGDTIESYLRDRDISVRRERHELLLLNPHREDHHFGSFHFDLRTGMWCDWATGERGGSFVELLKFLGIPADDAPEFTPTRTRKPDFDRMIVRIWDETESATGTIVQTYLESRAITCPVPPTIRFHSNLFYDFEHTYPGMVGAVMRDGQLIAIHRTYLDGPRKADVPFPKKALGSIRGGAVKLGEATQGVLAVTEGIETGLSIQLATGIPTWAALSAGGMTAVIIPPAIREVRICADGDDAGMRAAVALKKRLVRDGHRVSIAKPPRGKDFNDLLMEPDE